MLYFVDTKNNIVGSSTIEVEVEGLTLYPGPTTAAIADLFFDGEGILPKPPRPSTDATWNQESNEWEVLAPPPPPQTENWSGLLQSLRGSEIFGKIYAASTQNLRANSAYTLLISTLTTTHSLDDFEWALSELREGMSAASIGDFSGSDIAWINQKLEDNSFSLRLPS